MILCPLLPAFFSKFRLFYETLYDLILPYPPPPQYNVCENRTIIAWPEGEKIKTQGKKYDIFSHRWIFVLFLARQLK
jgi:hypothetical protein